MTYMRFYTKKKKLCKMTKMKKEKDIGLSSPNIGCLSLYRF